MTHDDAARSLANRLKIQVFRMLRRLSLAIAIASVVAAPSWATEPPLATDTDLMGVYKAAVENNADLAAAQANLAAQQESVPQALSALLHLHALTQPQPQQQPMLRALISAIGPQLQSQRSTPTFMQWMRPPEQISDNR